MERNDQQKNFENLGAVERERERERESSILAKGEKKAKHSKENKKIV